MVRSAFTTSVAALRVSSEDEPAAGAELRHWSHYTFVLWGDYFDETATVIFVSALRQIGLRVKIVGLAGPSAAGMNHLALGADLTLGEALALEVEAACLIIPCSGGTLRRFENDPRLARFLSQVCLPHTQVILKELTTLESTTLGQLPIRPENLAVYSASDDLLKFAHYTAQTLAAELWAA